MSHPGGDDITCIPPRGERFAWQLYMHTVMTRTHEFTRTRIDAHILTHTRTHSHTHTHSLSLAHTRTLNRTHPHTDSHNPANDRKILWERSAERGACACE